MKKSDKIDLLRNSIGTYNLCRCFFDYNPDYWYYYVLDVSDKLFLGIEEDDFLLDGFEIRKISNLKKVEIKDDICVKINDENKILANVDAPKIDISSWKAVFECLKALDIIIIVENEITDRGEDFFLIGRILDVKASHVAFSSFDADGIWDNDIQIPYSKITSVTFNSRYTKNWQEYFSKH
ncbi:MAG: hypothetical protein K2L12_02705 [Clostridia bacterium]|nr:hypothetical protein [Clostridia bacterium]